MEPPCEACGQFHRGASLVDGFPTALVEAHHALRAKDRAEIADLRRQVAELRGALDELTRHHRNHGGPDRVCLPMDAMARRALGGKL